MEDHDGKREQVIPGRLLIYFFIAHEAFSKDQANLKDFTVSIQEEESEVRIHFVPNRAPNERPTLGGRTSLGREVTYYVSKTDQKIMRWHFHR